MIEIAILVAAYFGYRGISAELVIDAGDDMPTWVRTQLYSARVLPYRIPLRDIITSMITQDKKNQMPAWIDIYVDK